MRLLFYIKRFSEIESAERKLLVIGLLTIFLLIPMFYILPLKYYADFLKIKTRKKFSELEKERIINRIEKIIHIIDKITSYNLSCFIKSATFKVLLNLSGIESKIEFALTISKSYIIESHAYIVIDNKSVFMAKNGFTKVNTLE